MCWEMHISLRVCWVSFRNCLWPLICSIILISPVVAGIWLFNEAPEPFIALPCICVCLSVDILLLVLLLDEWIRPLDWADKFEFLRLLWAEVTLLALADCTWFKKSRPPCISCSCTSMAKSCLSLLLFIIVELRLSSINCSSTADVFCLTYIPPLNVFGADVSPRDAMSLFWKSCSAVVSLEAGIGVPPSLSSSMSRGYSSTIMS